MNFLIHPIKSPARYLSSSIPANYTGSLDRGPWEYELELRWDYFTMKHTQWFYFRVSDATDDLYISVFHVERENVYSYLFSLESKTQTLARFRTRGPDPRTSSQ